jgi:hypothetical protein
MAMHRIYSRAVNIGSDFARRDTMKKIWSFSASVLLVAAALVFFAIPCRGQNTNDEKNPNVISRDSVAYGRTYGEWDAAWQQWAFSIPVTSHPLFDKGDCSVGQSGPVWFLGGKFCANGEPCDLANVVRNCAIPHGKAIYLPAFNAEDSALEETVAENPGNPDAQQVNFLRNAVDQFIVTTKPYVIIDASRSTTWPRSSRFVQPSSPSRSLTTII